ncbi:MAG TPA: short-chain dehydrogenase, partial [Clostridiales bacterium]|nr:short-chain dehydrogenase [Clostridiales bacterium]
MGKEFRLLGKTAIVTGGSNGLGEAIVQLFAQEGANVAIMDIAEPKEVPEGSKGRAAYFRGDVSNYQDCERVVSEVINSFGELNILVNNAGISFAGNILSDNSLDFWHNVLNVNLNGFFYMTKVSLPHMIKSEKLSS